MDRFRLPEDALARVADQHRAGNVEAAAELCREILAADEKCVSAWRLLGRVAWDSDDYGLAAECAQRELAIAPDSAEANNNLGTAILEEGMAAEAELCFRRALQINPNYATAHYNLGNALKMQCRYGEAAASYRRATEIRPDFIWAHVSLSNMWLLMGDLQRGWDEYEWRWKTQASPNQVLMEPRWMGEPLEGKTILVYAEQGLGDTLQFIRYVSLLKLQGARVIFACQKGLTRLLATCSGIDQLINEGELLPAFDVQLPLLSLPRVFGTTLANIPAEVPYLFADSVLVERWRARLEAAVRGQESGDRGQETGGRGQVAEGGGQLAGRVAQGLSDLRSGRVPAGRRDLHVGINWRGRPGRGAFRLRDVPLAMFERLAEIEGVRLVSLQRGEGRKELAGRPEAYPTVGTAHPTIFDPGDDVDTSAGAFMDTAAIMMNLDLVITSDTAVAHLAGALGVPVWVALPYVPDWRWLLDRSDSPWYPTMRLFRQRQPGDWAGVFEDVRAELGMLVV